MTRTASVLLAAVLFLETALSASAQSTIGGEWRTDAAAFAQSLVDAELSPGFGVAVAVGDWVAWAEGFGSVDLDTRLPVTDDTPFYIASTTKALTATAAALAARRGDLDLDNPMLQYLPGARLPDGVDHQSITVRDLVGLTHGLAADGPVVFRTAYTGDFTRPLLLELLRYHESTGEKGTFNYNNLGFNLLGLVLEEVYGKTWKEVVSAMVLEPLGMYSTYAFRSGIDPDRIAQPHRYTNTGYVTIPLSKHDQNLHAAGGHFASARDLARFLAAHQSGGLVEGVALLDGDALVSTHEQHVSQDRAFGPFQRFGWGQGWDLGTYNGDTLIHRFGSFDGYRSHVSFMPDHDIAVVVLVNGTGPASRSADMLATFIYDRMLGKPDLEQKYSAEFQSLVAYAEEYRRRYAQGMEQRAARLAPLRHELRDFAGTYENPVAGRVVWRVVANGLEVRFGVLNSRAEVFDAATNRLRFELAGNGKVAEFEFPEQGGAAASVSLLGMRFDRVRHHSQ